jgi:hypothetical protein
MRAVVIAAARTPTLSREWDRGGVERDACGFTRQFRFPRPALCRQIRNASLI